MTTELYLPERHSLIRDIDRMHDRLEQLLEGFIEPYYSHDTYIPDPTVIELELLRTQGLLRRINQYLEQEK